MKLSQIGALLYGNVQTRAALIVSLVLTALTTAVAVVFISTAQPVVPLFYTFTQPSQSLVERWWLLLIPSFSLLFSIICHLLHLFIQNLDRFVLQIFSWYTVFIQIVLLIALIRIMIITS